jgi:hypothetical protein
MTLKQIAQLALCVGAVSFIIKYATSGNLEYHQSALLSLILAALLGKGKDG